MCWVCRPQFAKKLKKKFTDEATGQLVRRTLLNRATLRGICRLYTPTLSQVLRIVKRLIRQFPNFLHDQHSLLVLLKVFASQV